MNSPVLHALENDDKVYTLVDNESKGPPSIFINPFLAEEDKSPLGECSEISRRNLYESASSFSRSHNGQTNHHTMQYYTDEPLRAKYHCNKPDDLQEDDFEFERETPRQQPLTPTLGRPVSQGMSHDRLDS